MNTCQIGNQHWQLPIRIHWPSFARPHRGIVRTAKICNRKKISVWFAFWGESRSRPKYMRVCGAHDKAFSDKLLSLCEALEAQHGARLQAATAALSIEGMIDGLWQNFLIGPSGFKRDRAIRAVFELFDTIYPDLRRTLNTNSCDHKI